ncbi:MAG: hypothetical protein ACE5Q3_12655 [Alphaproteobacteria bacterium]
MMLHLSRRLRGLVFSMLLALFLVPTHPAGAKETVALTFGWPSGLHGKVTFSVRTTRTVNGRREDVNMTGRYDLETSDSAEGLLIEFDNVQTEVENSGSGPQAMVREYMAKAASMPPSYIVSPDGHFVRIDGLEEFRNGILDGINDAFSEFPEQTREQVVQTLSAFFTREQLEASIISEWNTYVGTWLSAEMDEGDLYELTYSEPIPALGNMEVPMRATFLFKRRAPCNGDETIMRCVELEMRTFVDSEGLADAVEAFMARIPTGQNAPQIEDLQQETVVRLLSEPNTLLPYLMESSKRTSTTVSVGNEIQASSRIEEKRFVYTY